MRKIFLVCAGVFSALCVDLLAIEMPEWPGVLSFHTIFGALLEFLPFHSTLQNPCLQGHQLPKPLILLVCDLGPIDRFLLTLTHSFHPRWRGIPLHSGVRSGDFGSRVPVLLLDKLWDLDPEAGRLGNFGNVGFLTGPQVWSLTLLYNLGFLQSRITSTKCVFTNTQVKVCVSYFQWCPGNFKVL